MGAKSNISWTDASWSPITGCSRISRGCERYAGLAVLKNDGIGPRWTGEVRCHADQLDVPLHWKKPRMIFVNSMSDTFHEKVPFEFIDRMFAVMALCPQHTFQILTKRPERVAEYLAADRGPYKFEFEHTTTEDRVMWAADTGLAFAGEGAIQSRLALLANGWAAWKWPLFNVWLGTSCEDQATADERIPHLLRCPAAVRFLSLEPLLGPIDLAYLREAAMHFAGICPEGLQPRGRVWEPPESQHEGKCPIHWVIVGGESGPGFRSMKVEWLADIVEQCRAAQVPVFIKQDAGPIPGMRGNIPYDLWTKEFPQPKKPESARK